MAVPFMVRVAKPNDADAVGAVLRASYPTLMASGYPPDSLARAVPLMVRANPALLRCGTYYLAQGPDGVATGCGGWTFERPGAVDEPLDRSLGHIRHFATHPNWLRQGIGRALFERCAADARAAGVRWFECYSSLVAEPFYGALGFVTVEPITIDMGPGLAFPSIRMICPITD
jgi:GNAT superfamily N-acetyltransferase